MIADAATTSGPTVAVGGWVAFVIAAGALSTSATAVLVLIRRYLLPAFRTIDEVSADYRPNGGSSMRDVADKTHRQVDAIASQLSILRDHVEGHVEMDADQFAKFRTDIQYLSAEAEKQRAWRHDQRNAEQAEGLAVAVLGRISAQLAEIAATVGAPAIPRTPTERTT